MRKILSERNIVAVLFVVAFVVFYFAQEDAKRIEQMYLNPETTSIPLISPAKQTAGNVTQPAKQSEKTVTAE
ncbi:MAG: hypothetical protein EOO01_22685 [Chitinophagaceae bacterium]|nr:MAG: hypothetical protein EOO01_22685 [Chitinophagaceae bacterium]